MYKLVVNKIVVCSRANDNGAVGNNYSPMQNKLSGSYIDHFCEASMAIGLIKLDPEYLEILKEWRPISYLDYMRDRELEHAKISISNYKMVSDEILTEFDAASRLLNAHIQDIVIELGKIDRYEKITCHETFSENIDYVVGELFSQLCELRAIIAKANVIGIKADNMDIKAADHTRRGAKL